MAPAAAPKRSRKVAAPPAGQPPAPPPPARPVGKYERLCWERHERDLALAYPGGVVPADPTAAREASRHPRGLWFDIAAGERIVAFIEQYCRHSKGEWAGRRITLEEWQRRTWRAVFGWMRRDGSRRYRVAYIEIPRKNAKSTTAGAVGLYLQVGDREPGAEIYSSATKEDQAKIVWEAAAAMVKQSPELKRFILPLKKNLSCERLGSKFQPLGADSKTLDGLNPHGNIVDELHAHKDRALWDVLITAMGARRQPLTVAITTAGVYDPESIGWQMHDHATKVLEGVLEDDTFFAFIAAADENDDWQDPATWAKANPNLGVSVKLSYMEEQCQRAKDQPSFLNTFLRLHLDRWTQQVTRWIAPEAWDANAAAPAPLAGRVVYGALDLSTKLDITALALLATAEHGMWDLHFRFWVPEELVAARERKHLLPSYAAWVRDGFLLATPGNVIDYDFIFQDIVKLSKDVELKQLGFDPWNASQLALKLQQELNPMDAADGFQMVEMRQGVRTLSEPSKEFEKLIVAKRFRHGGQPVMRWMVANAAIRKDANDNIAPDKSSSMGKIDGVAATIMALGRAILTIEAGASLYEREDLLVL